MGQSIVNEVYANIMMKKNVVQSTQQYHITCMLGNDTPQGKGYYFVLTINTLLYFVR